MKLFFGILLAATVIGGFVGAEIMGGTFSILGAVIGGVGTASVLLGLGAYFDARDRKSSVLTSELSGVFDRMITGKKNPTGEEVKACKEIYLKAMQTQKTTGVNSSSQAPETSYTKLLNALEESVHVLDASEIRIFPEIRDILKKRLDKGRKQNLLDTSLSETTPLGRIIHMIAGLCFDRLCTGRYHIYRGILGPDGRDMHIIFLRAIEWLEAEKVMNSDEAKQSRESITQEIKEMG
jgi:hypothetical protein